MRILKDDAGRSKGIGFATFKKQEDAATVAEEGNVRFDFYELPVELATMSKAKRDQMEANKNRGDRGEGRFGDRDGGRGERGERREYREKQWGGDGPRGGGGYRRNDGDGGYRRNDGDGGYRRNNDGGDTILRRNINK